MRLMKDVNMDEVIAWKNNLFWFDNDNIQNVVKTLSRWYNVEIDIRGNIPDKFTGSVPMNFPLSKVVGMLQKTGRIQYKIVNDRKIIISP